MKLIAIGKVLEAVMVGDLRKIKAIIMGDDGVRTAYEVTPYGIDSNPIYDARNVYVSTLNVGEPVSIGYIIKNREAQKGETYLYSTNADGVIQFRIKLKADGTCEMNGTAHNLVRYTPLNDGLQDLKSDINVELGKIQTAISGLGGAYSRADVAVDISAAKINEIKTL